LLLGDVGWVTVRTEGLSTMQGGENQMRVIVIPADGDEPVREVDVPDTLAALQGLVGGRIETGIPFPGRQDITPMFNEDGKRLRLEPNARATDLLAPKMFLSDFIAGDCLLIGFDQVAGRAVDCPLRIEDLAAVLA
jgi:hypothetical protein